MVYRTSNPSHLFIQIFSLLYFLTFYRKLKKEFQSNVPDTNSLNADIYLSETSNPLTACKAFHLFQHHLRTAKVTKEVLYQQDSLKISKANLMKAHLFRARAQ